MLHSPHSAKHIRFHIYNLYNTSNIFALCGEWCIWQRRNQIQCHLRFEHTHKYSFSRKHIKINIQQTNGERNEKKRKHIIYRLVHIFKTVLQTIREWFVWRGVCVAVIWTRKYCRKKNHTLWQIISLSTQNCRQRGRQQRKKPTENKTKANKHTENYPWKAFLPLLCIRMYLRVYFVLLYMFIVFFKCYMKAQKIFNSNAKNVCI